MSRVLIATSFRGDLYKLEPRVGIKRAPEVQARPGAESIFCHADEETGMEKFPQIPVYSRADPRVLHGL